MTGVLRHAVENGYAVGYFEVWNLESLLAVKDAAEAARSPVIIGFNGGFLGNPWRRVTEDISVYGSLGRSVAEQSPVPMAKVNVGTALRRTFINSLKGYFLEHEVDRLDPGAVTSVGGPLDMLAAARAAVAAQVERLMKLFGSDGKAATIRQEG